MTIIAWDGKTLAADRQASVGYIKYARTTKIHRLREHLVGWTGDSAIGRELLYWFEQGADPEHFPKEARDKDGRGTLLVVTPDRRILSYHDSPYAVTWHGPVHAVGCGAEAALGAMMMGADAQKAVEIASLLVEGCGGGVDVLAIQGRIND